MITKVRYNKEKGGSDMKFKGRNGGLAVAMRNHIMSFRAFVISLLVFLVPTIISVCMFNPYFWVFLIMPLMFLVLSFAIFLFVDYDERIFLGGSKKDHIFEIKNNALFKDRKEVKSIQTIKIYRYNGFLYMETSHSMYIIKNTDYIEGNREEFIAWAKNKGIKVLYGY